MGRFLTRRLSGVTNAALIVAGFLVLSQRDAFAYLDPGTGSMLFQVVAGAVLASLFAVKMFWYRIKAFVTTTVGRRQAEQNDDDPD
ncbi:MAG: hypothetical protein WD533_06910 [Dehalococcoidia bacterium]